MATKKKTAKKKATKKKVAKKKAAKKKPAKKKPAKKKPAKKKPAKKKPAKKKPAKKAKRAVKKPTKTKFNLKDKVARPKEVAWRMIDGEAVIVTPADSMMHSLNEVGTRIWELMDGNRTVADIAAALQAEFEVDDKRVKADTVWFVECLAKKGLVTTA